MSDNESSEDEQVKALMAKMKSEKDGEGDSDCEDENKEKSKKKSKKKKKKKSKEKEKGKERGSGEDEVEDEVEDAVEKKSKKKKKKSKEKEKKVKATEKSPDDAVSLLSPTSKKAKKTAKDKIKKDKKEKKKKKKSSSQNDNEDEPIKAPAPVVLDPIEYVGDEVDGNASETSEDRKMKELLQQWDGDENSSSSSSSSGDSGVEDDDRVDGDEFERRPMTKSELGLEDNTLDHIVLAAPDFAEAMKEFEAMTGIRPSVGGSQKGLGTLTARVGFDNHSFIEIIAPDPKKAGPIGEQLMNMEEGSLIPIHYAIRQTDLSDLADDYVPNELGYDPDRIAMFKAGTDGAPRKWEMLFMHGHFHGGTVPYFVDWGECEHPISSIAQVGSLKGLVVSCPAGSAVHELLKGIKDVTVVDGDHKLEFSIGSPEGTITFCGDNPPGIKFPGRNIDALFRITGYCNGEVCSHMFFRRH